MNLPFVGPALRVLSALPALALAATFGCAASSGGTCNCDADTEKFDGEQCVLVADFTAPACEADDQPVCGCDGANYTSSCAALTAGVEVQYSGACRTATNDDGFDFGW